MGWSSERGGDPSASSMAVMPRDLEGEGAKICNFSNHKSDLTNLPDVASGIVAHVWLPVAQNDLWRHPVGCPHRGVPLGVRI